jgi:hypothetical protein
MAEKVNVLAPYDMWPFSTVIEEDMQSLVDGGLLCPLTFGVHPEWLVPGDEEKMTPPMGYIVSFMSFHVRGFRMPVSHFIRALPHYYGVELHNFNKNSTA